MARADAIVYARRLVGWSASADPLALAARSSRSRAALEGLDVGFTVGSGVGVDAKEIVERIRTMHWDMAACQCWICEEGRKADCHPRQEYLRDTTREQPVFMSWFKDSIAG